MEIEDYHRQLFNAGHQVEMHDFAALDANSKLARAEEENEQYQQHIDQLEAVVTEMEATILELQKSGNTQEGSKEGPRDSRDTPPLPVKKRERIPKMPSKPNRLKIAHVGA